ncbi:ATP-binding protein [Kribbella sp. NPDC005582]|uniref:sensor histidine kinase n=1 Tax=Kribbella sp. NPDC005582 TaxID=3156893 RepID=UPI0033B0AE4A
MIHHDRLLAGAGAVSTRAQVTERVAWTLGAPDRALDRFATLYGVALRLATVSLGGVAAFMSLAPPASAGWLFPVIGALGIWCLIFLSIAVRHGLTHRLVIADSLIVCGIVLLQKHLVAPADIPNSSAWLMPIATATVLLAQLRLHPGIGVPLGVLVTAAYVTGQMRAVPLHPAMLISAGILLIQTALSAATVQLLRRAGRAAELECEAQAAEDQKAGLAAAQRAEEREHFRHLHDTALATLTMVGSGSVQSGSPILQARAASDASALRILSGERPRASGLQRLDTRLRTVVDAEAAGLEVTATLPCVSIRGDALEAIAGCVGEALRNVARHAGVDTATVDVSVNEDGRVLVDIRDRGRGFDPNTVDLHSRGVRESIVGRMADAGGDAEIRSAPSEGTHIVLRWGDDERRR